MLRFLIFYDDQVFPQDIFLHDLIDKDGIKELGKCSILRCNLFVVDFAV